MSVNASENLFAGVSDREAHEGVKADCLAAGYSQGDAGRLAVKIAIMMPGLARAAGGKRAGHPCHQRNTTISVVDVITYGIQKDDNTTATYVGQKGPSPHGNALRDSAVRFSYIRTRPAFETGRTNMTE
jgi:hypothetical protein